MIMYGMSGKMLIPDVREFDAIMAAIFPVIKNDAPSAIGVSVIIVQYVVTLSQKVLPLA